MNELNLECESHKKLIISYNYHIEVNLREPLNATFLIIGLL
jgi:hypothetical protein